MKTLSYIITIVLMVGVLISLFLILFSDFLIKGKSKEERAPKVTKIRMICYIYCGFAAIIALIISLI